MEGEGGGAAFSAAPTTADLTLSVTLCSWPAGRGRGEQVEGGGGIEIGSGARGCGGGEAGEPRCKRPASGPPLPSQSRRPAPRPRSGGTGELIQYAHA